MFKGRFNLEMMVRNFYFFTIVAVLIGGITYFSVNSMWKSVSGIKEVSLPLLKAQHEMAIHLDNLELKLERLAHVDTEAEKKELLADLNRDMPLFTKSLESAAGLPLNSNLRTFVAKVGKNARALPQFFEPAPIDSSVIKAVASTKKEVNDMGNFLIGFAGEEFSYSEVAYGTAIRIIIFLTSGAIVGMLLLGFVLSKAVGQPVSQVTGRLTHDADNIEVVSTEISDGIKKQTGVVQVAVSDLDIMIKEIIEQKILPSVGKQTDISASFSDFLRHFVERTSAEIAMGTMSISQQAVDARESIGELVAEVALVEENIRQHEKAVGDMVEALKSIVEANRTIKVKASSSTEAAKMATTKAVSGQEMIERISTQLKEIKNSSEGVRDIIESLATVTESIKILALNMSLKVEDVKDDTGKTYGFEAMSAKVQGLAEEVEDLLSRSRSMMIPTIEGIAKTSSASAQAMDVIGEATLAIKGADEESKAIAEMIGKQAHDIDRVELEAENLRTLTQKTTEAIGAQGALAKDVDEMLKDSEMLIETVSAQTEESVTGARKVNKMMDDMEQTVNSIKEGTALLTDKSTGIADMFSIIRDLAEKNKQGAEQLDAAKRSVREVSRQLSMVVKGASAS
ncbi:MAG: methyl-accepting chemotaxis protein [Proteobacteria bacterium]|nr:methyl-accepting chemotaxis protein [Pseudomonadota bacterium]